MRAVSNQPYGPQNSLRPSTWAMRFFVPMALILGLIWAGGSCARPVPAQSEARRPELALSVRLPDAPVLDLHKSARFVCIFRNRGTSDVVLPVGRILLEENLFPRLYPDLVAAESAKGQSEFPDTIPPFQIGTDRYAVLRPGDSVEVPIRGLPWQAFRRIEREPRIDGHWKEYGTFYLRICFSGVYEHKGLDYIPDGLRSNVWRGFVCSDVQPIAFKQSKESQASTPW
jgi:hypothetical protein